MEHLVEKHSGKRQQESLLEAHQKELKKKRKVHIEVKTKADSIILLLKFIVLEDDFFWDQMLCSLVVRPFQNCWFLSTKICDVTSQWTLNLTFRRLMSTIVDVPNR